MNKRTLGLLAAVLAIATSMFFLTRPEKITTESGQTMTLGPLETPKSVRIGDKAPDFQLQDFNGEVHKLSDYAGKPIMLNFWAGWCPFCIEEMPLFENVRPDYRDQGLEIIGINRGETEKEARFFTDDMNLSYTLLLNIKNDVYQAYRAQGMPVTYFINTEGIIEDIKFGPIEEAELREKLDELVFDPKFMRAGHAPPSKPEMEDEEIINAPPAEIITYQSKPLRESGREIKTTEGIKHTVPLDKILGGGPPKDGIPSIDDPKFTSIKEANKFLDDEGLGIALSLNGIERFYPNQITVWHEIVNDNLGGTPALVTYCPLCGTGIVFDPTIGGEPVEFGTSGKLWNSNLVMYDRKTDTYWSQVLGEAVVGELAGKRLNLIPHQNIRYEDWKKAHPRGQVLSRDTGHFRDYNDSPYGKYEVESPIFFPVDARDDRYFSKAPTYGIVVNNTPKVYVIEDLQKTSGVIDDQVAGIPISITFNKDNESIKIINKKTDEEIVPFFGFWFSWFAAHPNTEVFKPQ